MRFLIIVKANAGTRLSARMAEFDDELARAGALLDSSGLAPSAAGWRIRYDGTRRSEIEETAAEAGQAIVGYTLIQARSREEAQAWTRRFPNPCDEGMAAEIEVRPLLAPGKAPLPDSAPHEPEISH